MTTEQAAEFQLIFEGATDTSEEALAKLREVLSAEFGLSAYAIEVFLQRAPIPIKRSNVKSELLPYKRALEDAGARVVLKEPEPASKAAADSLTEDAEEFAIDIEFPDEDNDRAEASTPTENDEPVDEGEIDDLLSQLEGTTLLSKNEPFVPLPTSKEALPSQSEQKPDLDDHTALEMAPAIALAPAPLPPASGSHPTDDLATLDLDDESPQPPRKQETMSAPVSASETEESTQDGLELYLDEPETAHVPVIQSPPAAAEYNLGIKVDEPTSSSSSLDSPLIETHSLETIGASLSEEPPINAHVPTSSATPPAVDDDDETPEFILEGVEKPIEVKPSDSESVSPQAVTIPPAASRSAPPLSSVKKNEANEAVHEILSVPTPSKKRSKFRLPALLPSNLAFSCGILALIALLGAANWLYFGSNSVPQQNFFDDIDLSAMSASSEKAPKIRVKADHWKAEENDPRYVLTAHLVTVNNKVRSLSFDLTTPEPAQPEPMEFVHGKRRDPWIKKVQSLSMQVKQQTATSFAGVGSVKILIDYANRVHRSVADVIFSGTIDTERMIITVNLAITGNLSSTPNVEGTYIEPLGSNKGFTFHLPVDFVAGKDAP